MEEMQDKHEICDFLSVLENLKQESTSLIGIGISSEILIASIQAHALTLNGDTLPTRYPYRFYPYHAPENGTRVSCELEYGDTTVSFRYSSNLSYASFILAIPKDMKKLKIATLYSPSMGACCLTVDGVSYTLHDKESIDLPDTINQVEVTFNK